MIYLKGLNGIRSIAAIGVLISHLRLWGFGGNGSTNDNLLGAYGVTMFFVLSGFLISYLLLKEKEKANGEIAVKKFYFRRILRIWPLYFLYLLIALLVLFFHNPERVDTGSVFFYFILMANVPMAFNVALPHIAHYWSLATEEQFYLFWPWLLRIKNEFMTLFLFLAGFLALKMFFYFVIKNHTIDYFFDLLRFDCMAIGGLGAVLFHQHRGKIRFIYHPFVQVIAWLFVVAVAINRYHIISLIDADIFAVMVTVIIINQCSNDKVLFSLDNKVFDFLGKISFGIYVYHPLVIYGALKLVARLNIRGELLQNIIVYTGVFIITIAIAYISYEYFEKYFLKMRSKFTIVETKNFKNT